MVKYTYVSAAALVKWAGVNTMPEALIRSIKIATIANDLLFIFSFLLYSPIPSRHALRDSKNFTKK